MNIVLLGATGSIGESTLKVIRKHRDRLNLVGIAANQNIEKLAQIAYEFGVPHVGIFDETAYAAAKAGTAFPITTQLHCGLEGLEQLAALPEADTTLVAVVGTHGLLPALRAIEAGKTLAIASKEILVLAGKFIMEAARESGSLILPVDSEHNAIFQCLDPNPTGKQAPNTKHPTPNKRHVDKLILTASGGSFRDLPLEQLANVTLEQALQHPNWDMGPKVTIDAATMANKGLEMIEARWLFGMQADQVQAVIHPQSIVHSMVQYVDGSVLAQLCPPDMTFAIQHCLLYPNRGESVVAPLDFSQAMKLDFHAPDLQRYPCLGLARLAMEACGIANGIFNAANEVAVDAFVSGKIRFVEISTIIEKTLNSIDNTEPSSLEEVLHYDQMARRHAADFVQKTST
ncbi:1-deoxy-D-xylulose-5-phosphate reductoisomerase [Pelagicoccus sp. SDUM812002]|uniref:1-deoxy-D-xylulose-5-phosphate reductoisomerase n=1 Tax=Pelagicoccus sp. SDUM812002 TaxID=3041266 RepID=UPI00280FBC46|nr:1-deoxy-D-xylulose-5-phosphate reductoisomerase [Pelagicoccus sp. SDUM812002]MDQ8184847.1 1-deoxy-D-xylulose-5-phosphate reductoisomerase [Pelagicoccus sp. SDUM812002]